MLEALTKEAMVVGLNSPARQGRAVTSLGQGLMALQADTGSQAIGRWGQPLAWAGTFRANSALGAFFQPCLIHLVMKLHEIVPKVYNESEIPYIVIG